MDSKNLEELRDTYLKAEREYVSELKKDYRCRKMIESLKGRPRSFIAEQVSKRFESIENGMVPEDDLEKVEAEIAILLASIQGPDRDEKEKDIDTEDEMDR